MALHNFIEMKGYKGKYSSIAAVANKHKSEELKKAIIHFKTSPGIQAQVE